MKQGHCGKVGQHKQTGNQQTGFILFFHIHNIISPVGKRKRFLWAEKAYLPFRDDTIVL